MKLQMIAFLIGFLLAVSVFGQDITGQWNGILKVQGTQLRLVFNINKTETVSMNAKQVRLPNMPPLNRLFHQQL